MECKHNKLLKSPRFYFLALSKNDGGPYDGEGSQCEETAQDVVQSIVQEMVNIVVGGTIVALKNTSTLCGSSKNVW